MVRSNRLDVCVPAARAPCSKALPSRGRLPAADRARLPAATEGAIESPHPRQDPPPSDPVNAGEGEARARNRPSSASRCHGSTAGTSPGPARSELAGAGAGPGIEAGSLRADARRKGAPASSRRRPADRRDLGGAEAVPGHLPAPLVTDASGSASTWRSARSSFRAAGRLARAATAAGARGLRCSPAPSAPPALAGAPTRRNQARLESTVRFLQDNQQPRRRLRRQTGEPGRASPPGSRSRSPPRGQPAGSAHPAAASTPTASSPAISVRASRRTRLAADSTTAFERDLLVVDAAGTAPPTSRGFDLVGEILSRQLPDGAFPYVPAAEAKSTTPPSRSCPRPLGEPGARRGPRRRRRLAADGQQNTTRLDWGVKARPERNRPDAAAAIEALVAGRTRAPKAVHEGLHPARCTTCATAASPRRRARRRIECRLDRVGRAGDLGGGRRPRNLVGGSGRTENRSTTWNRCSSSTAIIRWRSAATPQRGLDDRLCGSGLRRQALPIPAASPSAPEPTPGRSRRLGGQGGDRGRGRPAIRRQRYRGRRQQRRAAVQPSASRRARAGRRAGARVVHNAESRRRPATADQRAARTATTAGPRRRTDAPRSGRRPKVERRRRPRLRSGRPGARDERATPARVAAPRAGRFPVPRSPAPKSAAAMRPAVARSAAP